MHETMKKTTPFTVTFTSMSSYSFPFSLLILFLAFSLLNCEAQTDSREPSRHFPQREKTHRIMSYNVHHGRGMNDRVDIERIGRLINQMKPEVVGYTANGQTYARHNAQGKR